MARQSTGALGDLTVLGTLELIGSRLEDDDQGRFAFNTASVQKAEGLSFSVLGFSPLRDIRW